MDDHHDHALRYVQIVIQDVKSLTSFKVLVCTFVEKRFESRLASWKRQRLSKDGMAYSLEEHFV